jgi:hypothetical protein
MNEAWQSGPREIRTERSKPAQVTFAITRSDANVNEFRADDVMAYWQFDHGPRDLSQQTGFGHRRAARCGLAGLIVAACATTSLAAGDPTDLRKSGRPAYPPESIEFFESRVRPILVERCVKCHGPTKQSSSLRLDSRDSLLKGGESGPAVVPGKPEESLLIQAVSHRDDDLKMPPGGKLPDPAIAALRQWVALDAPWPTPVESAAGGTRGLTASASPGPAHWAFLPVRRVAPPPVQDRKWVRSPVDAFVLARLEAAGLNPSPPAAKRTLIRRATIDLWGIPPSIEEIQAFEADSTPDAFARVVDRLLASPRYGERWGRHWLDVARYADTKGYVFTQERRYPYAYTYRDYVIAALNADLGYDQFIVDQIAADQFAEGGDRRALAAMGFLTLGRRFLNDQNEIIDDRIDVVCRGLLGLTVTCARCHDHKYDPIPTEDYYSLYGVFASSVEPAELPLLGRAGSGPQFADYERKLAAANQARNRYLAARRDEFASDMKARFSQYFKAAFDLDFEPRSRRLEERALAARLDSPRLRALIMLWKRHLQGHSEHDGVLGPWFAFAALPRADFAAKAAELRRELLAPHSPPDAAVHPIVARAVLGAPSSSIDELAARYTALFAELEARVKDHLARSKTAAAAALPEPDWQSLRQSLFGQNGAFALAGDAARFVLNQSQRAQLERLNGVIQQLNATHPASPARAMVLADDPQPAEPHVFLRGDPGRPGKAIPRRFLSVLSSPARKPFEHGSGRLELARAIADARNPLTARVLVNRVWQWHFGSGLVATPSDFGLRSEPPTHPELLDELASRFMASGWSIKTLHRQIMLSSTYQQQSEPRSSGLARDPENRLLWRFNRLRLDFEAMRDSVLAVSGALRATFGGAPAPISNPAFSTRRTLYGLIDRQNLDGDYRTFDFAVPDATSPRRFVTSVPQQALYLMNSPFLHEQARLLAGLVHPESGAGSGLTAAGPDADPRPGIRTLYRRVLGRVPDPDELALATEFIRHQRAAPTTAPAAWRRMRRESSEPPLALWEQLSQVLLLTNEFMFVD